MSEERTAPRRRGAAALAVAAIGLAVAVAGAFVAREAGVDLLGLLGGAEEDARSGRPPSPARIVSTRRGRAVERFTTSGRVRAADAVTLTVEAPGRVAETLTTDSASVEAGEAILRLSDDDERAARDAAEARLAQAEADLARARELQDEGVAAEARVETALAAARAARASLAQAEAALAELTVRAPFAGRVGFVDVSRGAYLTPGDPIARLTAVDDLRIRFSLPQRLADDVAPGGTVAVSRGARACGEAEIVALAPAMAAETRSREIEARAPEGCGLRDGGFATVSVAVAARESAVFAPQAAIRREGFEAWAFTVEDGEGGLVARRAPVRLGVVRADSVEIREGLGAGVRIVGEGAQRLSDGAAIRPVGGDE